MSLVLNPVTSKFWELKIFKFRALNIKKKMVILGFPGGLVVKNPSVSVVDMGLMLESGRYPGKGNGNTLQNSYWNNFTDEQPGGLQCGGKESTQLSDLTATTDNKGNFT